MAISPIENVEESTQACKLHVSKLRDHYNSGQKLESEAAIQVVLHYFKHNCSHSVNNLKEAFEDYASKAGLEAFKYLVTYYTGAKGDGTKDEKRHTKAEPTYLAELELIKELDLVGWHKAKIGEANGTLRRQMELASAVNEEDKTAIMARHAAELTAEEDKATATKKANEKKKALAWFEAQAVLDPIAAMQYAYITGISELSYRDAKVASDVHSGAMGKIRNSLASNLANLSKVG